MKHVLDHWYCEAATGSRNRLAVNMESRLYTVPQAAAALNIGRTVTYELIRTGRLRSVKIGNLRRVPAAALDEFVAALNDPE